MPEVVRGSRTSEPHDRTGPTSPTSPTSPNAERRGVHFGPESPPLEESHSRPSLSQTDSGNRGRRKSSDYHKDRRKSSERPDADAYYDSRAATKREFKRRASTLQDYYNEHPTLLPQLPFTWRHGWRRHKLFGLIFLMFVDACVIPLVLYYAMTFAGNVQGWIVFAIVATIWGGPTYVEFGLRSWRLIKKENFYRPLGTTNRWHFDVAHWIFTLTIGAVTALLVVGSAPHIVFLRVLSLPGPAILICLGAPILIITMYHITGRPAPFRLSSTPKGGKVCPGVFYLMEDVVAVNANAGRPYREALHARYNASPRFRKLMLTQSLFWSIPSLTIGIVLTIIICIHNVKKEIGYGLGWGIPFVWAAFWSGITVFWGKREMQKERTSWEMDQEIVPKEKSMAPLDTNSDREAEAEGQSRREPEP